MDALSEIWNEDGTPKRPEPNQGAEHAFADLAMADKSTNRELYLSYARIRAEALANQPASVGDMVHVWTNGLCRAAIVTQTSVFDDEIHVSVFVPGELTVQPLRDVAHDEKKSGYAPTYHWPESE
jgi:hypothetical protein